MARNEEMTPNVLWLETNRGFHPLPEDQIIEKSTLWLPLTGRSEGNYLYNK